MPKCLKERLFLPKNMQKWVKRQKRPFDPLLWLRGGDLICPVALKLFGLFFATRKGCRPLRTAIPFRLCACGKTQRLRNESALKESKSGSSNPPISPYKNKPRRQAKPPVAVVVVAGRGFEPPDLRVMSPTSYRTAPPRDTAPPESALSKDAFI